jgi:hypothetical protein
MLAATGVRCDPRPVLLKRGGEPERAAQTGFALEADAAFHHFHKLLRDGQT